MVSRPLNHFKVLNDSFTPLDVPTMLADIQRSGGGIVSGAQAEEESCKNVTVDDDDNPEEGEKDLC